MQLTKKKVLLVGFGALILLILLGFGEANSLLKCSFITNERVDPYGGGFGPGGVYKSALVWDTVEWCEPLASLLLLFPPVFLFSLITYFLREEVFQAWMHFAKWWIPLSIFFVLIIPDGQGGGYMPSLIDKQTIAFLMSSVFVLVSITKIISNSIELRGK